MKLDRLKFAKLIAHCCSNGLGTGDWEIERIDELCEYEAPAQPVGTAKCSDVDSLMMLMAEGTSKIEAIMNYRVLTGAGLKESKEAIERYRSIPNFPKKDAVPAEEVKVDPKAATLGDILHSVDKRDLPGIDGAL